VQQRAGVHLKGGVGQVDDPYEQHADRVADLVVRGESAEAVLDERAPAAADAGGAGHGAVQCRKPGQQPTTIDEQLRQRMARRNEGQFPDEETLIAEVDTLMLGIAAPPALANAHDLVAKAMSDYAFSAQRANVDDLASLSAALTAVMLTEHSNYAAPHPVAALQPAQLFPQLNSDVQVLIRQAVVAWCQQHNQLVPTLAAIDATYHIDLTGTGEVAAAPAQRFLMDHPATAGFTGSLTPPNAALLRQELEKLDVVQRALTGKHDEVAQRRAVGNHSMPGSAVVQRWMDPTVRVDDGSERGTGELDSDELLEEQAVPAKVRAKIRKAGEIICSLVERSTLERLGDPEVYVHVTKDRSLLERLQAGDFSAAPALRAYSSGYERAIHIDQRDEVDVIVHEIGHQLEHQLPTELWLDVQRLLHGRHSQATAIGQPDNLVAIYPDSSKPSVRDEAAYRADMPATGRYSAKHYDGEGPTEVVSMAMQFLASPKTARKLLTDDPLQAAIVLRRIAPQEFALKVSAPAKALLPS
jgi:hypothetical protein